jgi:hypothetical protein
MALVDNPSKTFTGVARSERLRLLDPSLQRKRDISEVQFGDIRDRHVAAVADDAHTWVGVARDCARLVQYGAQEVGSRVSTIRSRADFVSCDRAARFAESPIGDRAVG